MGSQAARTHPADIALGCALSSYSRYRARGNNRSLYIGRILFRAGPVLA
jgi:hypothetical protein